MTVAELVSITSVSLIVCVRVELVPTKKGAVTVVNDVALIVVVAKNGSHTALKGTLPHLEL